MKIILIIILIALAILLVLFFYSTCKISSECSRIEERMENMLNQEQVKRIKEQYPSGMRVKLNYMDDPYGLPSGTMGTIDFVDDSGQIHVHWDNGSTLALIPNVDSFSVVTKEMEI